MANNTITVFEHSQLHFGEQGFEQRHFDALLKYNDLYYNKYFSPGYKKITFKSYIGVIQAGDKVIEILPKADKLAAKEDATKAKWQIVLMDMLKRAGFIKLNETEKATQQFRCGNILDNFLFAYLKEVEQLIHVGLLKKYRRCKQNKRALKGRLLIKKQIQYNNIHKERFFTEHTIYDRNNIFNSILKRALEIVNISSTNYSIKQDAAKQLLCFEHINSWCGESTDFGKLIFDRKSKPYIYAIDLAKLIILNYFPDMSAGKKPILAILFDMNQLFEKFIYRILKKEENNFREYGLNIIQQRSQPFWKSKTIRPDIVICFKIKDENKVTKFQKIIVDTKWKIIDDCDPADDDLKQMYTYNLQCGSFRSILLYPSIGQINEGPTPFKKGDHLSDLNHSCELYFADLFDQNEKINLLFANKFISYLVNTNQNL